MTTPLANTLATYWPSSLIPPSYLTKWTPGTTPISTLPEVATYIAIYLTTIFGIRAYMNSTKSEPIKLNGLFQVHNVILTLGSGLLLVLMLEEVGVLMWNHGPFYAVCGPQAWTPRLETFYIINYYFKYLELLDTVFLALKKKPLTFLHVFHHSATAALCYNQLNGQTTVSWVVISLNLAVHVLMYYYYYATAGGRKIWWKKYITTMQITQFVIDMAATYFATYNHFAFAYTKLPNFGDCHGAESSALFGCALLTFYLFLFIDFYRRTYNAGAKKLNGNGNGVKVNGNGNGYTNGNGVKANGNGTSNGNGVKANGNGYTNGNGVHH